jgi:hypothetical protein
LIDAELWLQNPAKIITLKETIINNATRTIIATTSTRNINTRRKETIHRNTTNVATRAIRLFISTIINIVVAA